MKLIRKIKRWLNIKLGLYHWYNVRINYRQRQHGDVMFWWMADIGLVEKTSILSRREVAETTKRLDKSPGIPVSLLCNGVLDIQDKTYLGHMTKYSKI